MNKYINHINKANNKIDIAVLMLVLRNEQNISKSEYIAINNAIYARKQLIITNN